MTITSDTSAINKIRSILPPSISNSLSRLDRTTLDRISEIRLRKNRIATLTVDGKNLVLSLSGLTNDIRSGIRLSDTDIDDFIYKFCKGSVYSHEDTLSDFYIVNDSIRVGLSGDAVYKNDKLISIGNISGVCIRIPRHVKDCSIKLMNHIKDSGFPDGKGILIVSPPGVGKTTLLRDLAQKLSSDRELGLKRVCVIDERNEIFMENIFSDCCIDFLSGVGKIKGLEIASRVLSPEIIICDEIASPDEAEKITRHKNTGVVFIASVHSDCHENVMRKDYIEKMFKQGVFSHTYTLSRSGSKVLGELSEYKDV